jgi:hypothetical protein
MPEGYEGLFATRVLGKLDDIENKVDDLCNRMTKMETTNDIKIKDAIHRTEFKFKLLSAVVGVIGSSFVILNIAKFWGLV